MAHEALKKFAEELKSLREAKKITLQQIATKTKIDIKFLIAIDEAKFDILPELYIKAFIKEYAFMIDANPDEIAKKFIAAKQGKATDTSSGSDVKTDNSEIQTTEFESTETLTPIEHHNVSPDKLKINYILGGAVLLVVIILSYFLFIHESTPEIITEQTYNPTEESKPAFEVDSQLVAVKNKIHTDSLQLSIKAIQRVWVKVLSDRNLRFEGMFAQDEQKYYNASKEFRVVVGNAGNVQLALNGKNIEGVGEKGEIKNLILSADTVKSYPIVIPAKNEDKPEKKN